MAHGRRGRGALQRLLNKAVIPHLMAPLSRLKHLPNTPPLNIMSGIAISTYEFGGNENMQTKTSAFPGPRSGVFSSFLHQGTRHSTSPLLSCRTVSPCGAEAGSVRGPGPRAGSQTPSGTSLPALAWTVLIQRPGTVLPPQQPLPEPRRHEGASAHKLASAPENRQ